MVAAWSWLELCRGHLEHLVFPANALKDPGLQAGDRARHRRERKKGNKLFHCRTNQTRSPAVEASNGMSGNWGSRADWPHFIWKVWLIDSPSVKTLGLYTQPATHIYKPGSIFTCDLSDCGSFANRLSYWFNWRHQLFGIDWTDCKESNLESWIDIGNCWGLTSNCTYSSWLGFNLTR